jgi:hypothetical protein
MPSCRIGQSFVAKHSSNLVRPVSDDQIEEYSIGLVLAMLIYETRKFWGAPKPVVVASHKDMAAFPRSDL